MSKERVLVVDDEQIARDTMTDVLRNDGFEAVGVSGGAEALAELDKNEYGLLVTDVVMPKMNGIELISAVIVKKPTLEMIVVSGHGTEATKDKLRLMGVFGYVEKPVKAIDLVTVAREAIKSNRLARLGTYGADPPQVVLTRQRILVADDDPAVLDALKTILSDHGYNVTAVDDGEKTYEMLLINDYDMIVLDINMPKLNGIETVKLIRKFDPCTYILLISGESEKDEITEAQNFGANKFLAKPFSPNKLLELVKKVNFEKIKKQKQDQIDKIKYESSRNFGWFRRFFNFTMWLRLLRANLVEFILIVFISAAIGALAVFLSEENNRPDSSDDSFIDKATTIEKYLQRDEQRELKKDRFER